MPSRTFIGREEKSVSGFKASKNKHAFFIGSKVASDFKLKPVLIYYSKNPRTLKNYTISILPEL